MRMYDSYKDSGIEYINEIPVGWEVKPLYTLFTEVKEKNKGNMEKNVLSLSYGNIKKRDVESNMGLLPESFETYNRIKKDDIVLRLTDLQNDKKSLRTGLVKENGIITSAYVTLRKRNDNINPQYAQFLLHAYDVKKVFYNLGAGVRQSMGFAELKKMFLLLPSIKEQNKIVVFLTKKTAEIDNLVNSLKSFLGKLEQQRQLIITETVSKGLNPNVKMKDSGVEWIGEVPEHWKILKLKRIISYLTDFEANGSFSDVKDNVSLDTIEEYAWFVRATDLQNNRLGLVAGNRTCDKASYEFLSKTELHGEELLVAKRGEIGKCYMMPNVKCKATLAPNLYLIRTKDNCKSRYVYYWLKSDYGKAELILANKSTTIGALYKDDIKESMFILPPLDEQEEITSYLENMDLKVNDLISNIVKKIQKLKDYRQSLIYEIVTGKIDVREMEVD